MEQHELLRVEEAAKLTSSSVWTWRAHIKRGSVRVVRFGRKVLIPRSELERISREGLPSLKPLFKGGL